MTWLGLALCALASFRAARLVALDTITEPLRQRLELWAYPGDREHRGRVFVQELTACPHCIGFHFAWITVLAWLYVSWLHVPIFMFAAAGGQSLLASWSAE